MFKILQLMILTILFSSCDKNKVIYIADHQVKCEDHDTQMCMKVKENLEDDWTIFHDQIDGFKHEQGTSYTLEVAISKEKNNLAYKLIKVIKQEKSPEKMAQAPLGNWTVSHVIGIDSLAKKPTLVFENGKISGNAGCNNYGASYEVNANKIAFGLAMATKMFCSNMKIEKAFFECLQNTTHYELKNGALTLYSKDNEALLTCEQSKN